MDCENHLLADGVGKAARFVEPYDYVVTNLD